MDQVELERAMLGKGAEKISLDVYEAERSGNADRNPYTATLYRDYVTPFAQYLEKEINEKKPGRAKAHVALLRPLDPWAVAFIAVRTTIVLVSSGEDWVTLRSLGHSIGKRICDELYLTEFSDAAPDYYYVVRETLSRRWASDEAYIAREMRKMAAMKGMVFDDWGRGAKDQVGLWAIQVLVELGLLEIGHFNLGPGHRKDISVDFTEEVWDVIRGITESIALTRPFYGPCIEPPKDWTGWTQGGWHTPEMRRALPNPVKARSAARVLLKDHDMPIVLDAMNALQRTAWQVNKEVLSVVTQVAAERSSGEIVLNELVPPPHIPDWIDEVQRDERTPEQEEEFKGWKSLMSNWYTAEKLARVTRQRFKLAIQVAREYERYERIYFVFFADSRGRLYPMTQGIDPQGSDLQRGLLRFAEGKPLDSEGAVSWFKVHGANSFGIDKVPFPDRIRWVDGSEPMLLNIGRNPIDHQDEWLRADKPLQFLAWCMEYVKYVDLRDRGMSESFVSYLPVGMDGSCSGLQHYSAMLRDEVGGQAVNLTPNNVPQDIYATVARAAEKRLQSDLMRLRGIPEPSIEEQVALRYAGDWMDHGLNRSMTKRPTMTTPYGVTRRTATRYLIKDYMAADSYFDPKEHYPMAAYIMGHIWPAIGDVVVKGREAMDWLSKSATQILKNDMDHEGAISWMTPSGFLATQAYYDQGFKIVRTQLYGHAQVKVMYEHDTPSTKEHKAGLPPNFVHSMDAAHLHRTVARCAKEVPDMSFGMVHDEFGCHASDAPALAQVLREEFVAMYTEHDPLQEFADKHELQGVPEKGTLDLSKVVDSPYIFA